MALVDQTSTPMSDAEVEVSYPLSPMQQGMLVQTLSRPGSAAGIQQIKEIRTL